MTIFNHYGQRTTLVKVDRVDIRSTEMTEKNKEKDISLYNEDGVFVDKVNQADASRLLKHGLAELVFEMPPSIKLVVAENNKKYKKVCDWNSSTNHNFRSHSSRVNELAASHYGNYHVLSPKGTLMFHCGARKCLWYLSRNLATIVHMDPPTIQFKFQPKGFGHAGDDYYLSSKKNECVVCRSNNSLSRHHVVPTLYRKFFEQEIKDHSHHDILLLCSKCHEKYERKADNLKVRLAKQYDCPVHGIGGKINQELNRAILAVNALRKYSDQIPESRKEELRETIRSYFGDADFDEIDDLNPYDGNDWISHGKYVVERLENVQDFVEMWREHFVNSMHPTNMPEHWDLQRSIYKI